MRSAENRLRREANNKGTVYVCHTILSTVELSSAPNTGRATSQIASAATRDACSQRWVSSNVGTTDCDGFMISTVQFQFPTWVNAESILEWQAVSCN